MGLKGFLLPRLTGVSTFDLKIKLGLSQNRRYPKATVWNMDVCNLKIDVTGGMPNFQTNHNDHSGSTTGSTTGCNS